MDDTLMYIPNYELQSTKLPLLLNWNYWFKSLKICYFFIKVHKDFGTNKWDKFRVGQIISGWGVLVHLGENKVAVNEIDCQLETGDNDFQRLFSQEDRTV